MQDFIHFALNSPIGLLGWVALIVGVFFFWPRGRVWLIAFIVLLFVAMWMFTAIKDAIDRTQREVAAQVDEAKDAASEWIPDWLKEFWKKVPNPIPSPTDKACDLAGVAVACNIYEKVKKNLEQLKADVALTDEICKDSQAVAHQFGEQGKIKFCAGNTFKNTQKTIKFIMASAVQGSVASVVPDFFMPDSPSLDTDVYLNCLYRNVTAVPGANARSCKYDDRHKWRLCVEFHMQLPHEQLGEPPAPLEQRITDCRQEALQKPTP